MSITFNVNGKPPKKDGSSSWSKKSEAINIVNLSSKAPGKLKHIVKRPM